MAEIPNATSEITYRPLAGLALAGFGISCLFAGLVVVSTLIAISQGAPFFFSDWVLLIAVAGVVVSWLGLNEIRNSEGTKAGQKLATVGIWLSVVTGAGYFAYSYFTGLALSQQAVAFLMEEGDESGFFPLLQKSGKDPVALNRAFLLSRPVLVRENIRPDHPGDMARFDQPRKEGSASELALFRNDPLVVGIALGGKDSQIESLGMQNWKYDKRSYQVTCEFRIKTPEDVQVLTMAATTSEGEEAGQARRWFADMTSRRPISSEKTTLGKGLAQLRKSAITYLQGLEAALRKGNSSLDWNALDKTDWNQLLVNAPSATRERLTRIFLGKALEQNWKFSVQYSEQMLTEWERDAQGRLTLTIPVGLMFSFDEGPPTGGAETVMVVRSVTPVDPERLATDGGAPPAWELTRVRFERLRNRDKR